MIPFLKYIKILVFDPEKIYRIVERPKELLLIEVSNWSDFLIKGFTFVSEIIIWFKKNFSRKSVEIERYKNSLKFKRKRNNEYKRFLHSNSLYHKNANLEWNC